MIIRASMTGLGWDQNERPVGPKLEVQRAEAGVRILGRGQLATVTAYFNSSGCI